MSYQPPSDWMTWDLRSLAEKDKPPPSVRIAVRFMLAGAVIEVLVLIGSLAAYQSALSQLYSVPGFSGQLHWAEAAGRVLIIGTSLSRVALWVWMASRDSAGRGWARVLSTVFFVINSLALAYAIAVAAGGGWRLVAPVATWLVGVCAIVLLWRGESGEFFAAQSQH